MVARRHEELFSVRMGSSTENEEQGLTSTISYLFNMCDTKFSIYLYSVRFGIRACAGGHVSPGFSVVGIFKRVFGMVFFSLGVLLALFHFF